MGRSASFHIHPAQPRPFTTVTTTFLIKNEENKPILNNYFFNAVRLVPDNPATKSLKVSFTHTVPAII